MVGKGNPFLSGIKNQLKLKLMKTEQFRSGNILLCYQQL
ncbi:hypothetical protein [Cytobacillus purgationiresistens]